MSTKMPKAPSHDPHEAAHYIATLTADLAAMARQNRLDTLGYLLEIVRLEAESLGRTSRA